MNNIINKTYVINLKHRKDRWNKIKDNFKDINIKLTRWDAVYGADIPDDEIKKITTTFCNYICSPGMIGCWLSHKKIWENIVKNNEDNVLVLEDDAIPIDDFENIFVKKWKNIPKDFDIVYLGCGGSCEKSSFINTMLYLLFGNKDNKIINDDVIRPYFPLGTHAYIISNKGAKKLVNSEELDKIMYHIDFSLCRNIYSKDDFKVYAIRENLIKQDTTSNSDILNSTHPIIQNVGKQLKVTDIHTIESISSIQIAYNRHLGLSLTMYTSLMFIISLIIGYIAGDILKYTYTSAIILIYLLELIIWRSNIDIKLVKTLIFELILIMLGLILGSFLAK